MATYPIRQTILSDEEKLVVPTKEKEASSVEG